MLRLIVCLVIFSSASTAFAYKPHDPEVCEDWYARNPDGWHSGCIRPFFVRHDMIQADLGLSVIQLGYEHRLSRHFSASLSAGVFGSYFLPWFDLGDNVIGLGGGVRVTWFSRKSGRGFYVAPYARGHRVSGDHEDMHGTGLGFSAGAFAGWAFGIGDKIDIRVGAGAQFIDHYIDTPAGRSTSSTPFVALDLVVAYRL
jgi:hypothetical protein